MAKQQRRKIQVAETKSGAQRVLTSRSGRNAPKKRLRVQRVLRALRSPELKQQPLGSYVVINVDTGEYVSAQTMIDANTSFMEKFPGATGFAHRLGEPLFSPLRLDP